MIKYFSHFILVVTFFVCNAFAWAETNVAEKYGCKNLHEIQSGEDALKQLYDNLNTDCFAKISDIELEKVWGIGVYDIAKIEEMDEKEFSKYADKKPVFKGKMADKLSARLSNKNYLTIIGINERITFYNVNTSILGINIFPYNDKFPVNLPKPIIDCEPPRRTVRNISAHQFVLKDYGIYSPKCEYFWKGNNQKNKLLLNIEEPDKYFILTGSIFGFKFLINAD